MISATLKSTRVVRAQLHVDANMLLIDDDEIDSASGCIDLKAVPRGTSIGCDVIDIMREEGYVDDQLDPLSDYAEIVSGHFGSAWWFEELREKVYLRLASEKRKWWHVAQAECLRSDADSDHMLSQVCWTVINRSLAGADYWEMPIKRSLLEAAEETLASCEKSIEASTKTNEVCERATQLAQTASLKADAAPLGSASWKAAESARVVAWSFALIAHRLHVVDAVGWIVWSEAILGATEIEARELAQEVGLESYYRWSPPPIRVAHLRAPAWEKVADDLLATLRSSNC